MNLIKEESFQARQKAQLEKFYAGNVFSDSADIEKIRQEIKERHKKQKDIGQPLFDQCDVDRVMSNDWAVRRYLIAQNGNVKRATEKLDKSLRWRKNFGVNVRNESDLPIEFVRAGAIFPFFEDKEGRITIFVRVKVNRKVSSTFTYYFEKT